MTAARFAFPLSLAVLLAACPPSKKTSTCTGSSVSCNGSCVVVATDPNNCGSCGNICPAGQSCAAGACACPSGQTACGDLCSVTSTDALNCGACGNACLNGELCQNSQCVCETGRTACGKRCVDLTSDPSNCGACGTTCSGATAVCSDSSCAAYCAGADGGAPDGGGVTDCGGACVDIDTDPTNCGGCGQACLPGGLCSGGSCTCGAGETACDGGCFDLGDNQQNCGACGTACAPYQVCSGSACVGPDLYVACSDYNFTTSTSNAIVGLNSVTGSILLPAQPIAAPPPDGGAAVEAQIAWTLFTDPHTLWVLDTTNDQIDVLDVTTWPATVKGSVATGSSPDQLLLCGGLVIVTNSVGGTSGGTVQGIDPTTMQTVAEVDLGVGENPTLLACDGAHTVYVADWEGGDIKSIDVSQAVWAVGQTLAVPAANTAILADGGLAAPSPNGVAFIATDGGGEVLVSLENLDIGNDYAPVGPSTVLVMDPKLQGVLGTIDPGASCQNGQVLTVSPAGSPVLETCSGTFYSSATTGVVVPIAVPANSAASPVTVPLANPDSTTFLKNGLVAVGDEASGSIAIWNPADGGVIRLDPCAATLADGGLVSTEIVGAVVGAP